MATDLQIELYAQGAHVWIPSDEEVWICGTVEGSIESGQLTVIADDATEIVDVSDPKNLPPLRNPEILVGSNDLTHLSYLHEPAVMHNLKVRFLENNSIYTYCGIVLVAMNPYETLPIFTEDTIAAYKGKTPPEMDPHVFAIAEDAFACLFREERNQSIIVSGESGAGKTVNAKFAMRYFASVGGAADETQIEKKILASNPLMEAIGNAKTTRNDNSSRFGKYIEIMFSEQHEILGANMKTYLLEKSRLVHQATDERNYHIFYQMCASLDNSMLEPLDLVEADDFFFTNQGENTEVDDVDDAEEFKSTVAAMETLGIDYDVQFELFQILGGLLHMGNTEVVSTNNEDSSIDEDDANFLMTCGLLGLDDQDMIKWMTNRKIQTGKEVFTKPLTVADSQFALMAFAKHIYAHVFDWIVACINEKLAPTSSSAKPSKKPKPMRTIGVLDIYGFETFEINSFEQFCINYANEKLQQLFNQHVFKLEQDEYVREKITWSFIDFYDNQPCIDLIENKMGVLTLLDEECKVPRGNDEAWAAKMYKAFADQNHFVKPRLSNTAFIIKHYACDVQYEVEGFLHKNKDTLYEEHLQMLRDSAVPLVASMFDEPVTKKEKVNSKAKGKPKNSTRETVGTQFYKSLNSLMAALNATEPHYIRCIKPNDKKQAFSYNNSRCIEQLRACGVLETVRISAAGYPSRWKYDEFLSRYEMLSNRKTLDRSSTRASCEGIIKPLITDEDKFQFGKTKLFFRAGQVAYLEKLRSDKRAESAIMIQKSFRQFRARRTYLLMKQAAILMQRYARGQAARRLAQSIREVKAAIKIQTSHRRYTAQKEYVKKKEAVQILQRMFRGMCGRRAYRAALEDDRAIKIQTCWRRYSAATRYFRARSNIILVQSTYRRMVAMRELRKLKTEARSVAGVQAKNLQLEAQVRELHAQLKELREHTAVTDEKDEGVDSGTKPDMMLENDTLKKEVAELKKELSESQDIINELQGEQSKLDPNATSIKAPDSPKRMNENGPEFYQTTSFSPHTLEPSLSSISTPVEDPKRVQQQLELLRAHAQELENENDKIRAQNKELIGVGTAALASTLVDTELDVNSQLAAANTNVSRLKLANTKLHERVLELEKNQVRRASKLLSADVETNDRLRERLRDVESHAKESDEKMKELRKAYDTLEAQVDDKEKDAITWRAKYLDSVAAAGTGDIMAKVSALETEKAELAFKLNEGNDELSTTKKSLDSASAEIDHLKLEIQQLAERLRKAEGALNKKISVNKETTPTEMLQEEVRVLVEENLVLREKSEKLEEIIASYKASGMKPESSSPAKATQVKSSPTKINRSNGAATKLASKHGLVVLSKNDISRAIGDLIVHLNLRNMKKEVPGLIAHLLFMCIMFADDSEDGALLQEFLAKSMGGIKEVVMNNSTDLNALSFWLSNTYLLLNNMKHYSGEDEFATKGEVKSLKTFDLQEYRKVLGDLLMQIYCTVIKHIEHRITNHIVPCFLDYEPIAEMRNPNRVQPKGAPESTVTRLLEYMTGAMATLLGNHVEPRLISQIFRQVFYFINATMVNNLILRKDLCHWSSGMQIRHNLASLEEWSQKHNLGNLKGQLIEVTQVCQLLQVNKSSAEDVDLIYETCNQLNSHQVQKVLSMYTPSEGEDRVPANLIRLVAEKGSSNGKTGQLMLNAGQMLPWTVPFSTGVPDFRTIALPKRLKLDSYMQLK